MPDDPDIHERSSSSARRRFAWTVQLVLALPMVMFGVWPSLASAWLSAPPPWFAATGIIIFASADFLGLARRGPPTVEGPAPFAAGAERLAFLALGAIVLIDASDWLALPLLIAKAIADVGLALLEMRGPPHRGRRLRSSMQYATWALMLAVPVDTQVTRGFLVAVLSVNLAFQAITIGYFAGILHKRFIADAISGANLVCGGLSMYHAHHGRLGMSLALLVLGAAFDGFDGAAARRWGGTRFGVYSDDIADGVNYGIAPGYALHATLMGVQGTVVGVAFSLFTISRLVFFTLDKAQADPNLFRGVPSTVGGLLTLCSLIVFRDQPAIVGLMVGIACMQMVAFSAHYKHLGRAAARHRRRVVWGVPAYVLVLAVGFAIGGLRVCAALIMVLNCAYGFMPTILAFRDTLRTRREI